MDKNKRKPILIIFHVVTISLFGLSLIYIYNNPQQKETLLITPTIVVSPIPEATCTPVFADNFENIKIDEKTWDVASTTISDNRDSFSTQDRQLTITIGLTPTWRGRSIEYTNVPAKNIDAEVDVLPLDIAQTAGNMIGQMVLRDKELKNGVVILRVDSGVIQSYQIIAGKSGTVTEAKRSVPKNVPVRLRISTENGTVKTYYKTYDQSDYTLLTEYTGISAVLSNLRLTATGAGTITGTARFDNFSLCSSSK